MDTIAVASHGAQSMRVEPELIQVLSVEQFMEKCLQFNEVHGELQFEIRRGVDCPVHIYAKEIGQRACKTAVSGIKDCSVCHKPMCPCCGNHAVSQLSRVTGYVGDIGGWNSGKAQELKDRQRYNIGVGGSSDNVQKRG